MSSVTISMIVASPSADGLIVQLQLARHPLLGQLAVGPGGGEHRAGVRSTSSSSGAYRQNRATSAARPASSPASATASAASRVASGIGASNSLSSESPIGRSDSADHRCSAARCRTSGLPVSAVRSRRIDSSPDADPWVPLPSAHHVVGLTSPPSLGPSPSAAHSAECHWRTDIRLSADRPSAAGASSQSGDTVAAQRACRQRSERTDPGSTRTGMRDRGSPAAGQTDAGVGLTIRPPRSLTGRLRSSRSPPSWRGGCRRLLVGRRRQPDGAVARVPRRLAVAHVRPVARVRRRQRRRR